MIADQCNQALTGGGGLISLLDTFTEVSDTPILSHVSEDGVPWQVLLGTASNAVVGGGTGILDTIAVPVEAIWLGKCAGYLDMSMEIVAVDNVTASIFLRGKFGTSASSDTVILLGVPQSNQVIIRQTEAGVLTTNVTLAHSFFPPYALRGDIVGRALTIYINDIEVDSRLMADIDYTGYDQTVLYLRSDYSGFSNYRVDPI